MRPSCCKPIAGIIFTLTLLVCSSYPLLSQSSGGSATKSPHAFETTFNKASAGAGIRPTTLRVSSDLVLVPITVTDGLNHPQTNLGRGNFTVFEGEQAQEIRYFSSEDSPISVGLLLDVSRSMQDKIDTERIAVDQFFKNANPQDDYFVITFNNELHVLSDVTQSTTGIENELGLVQPSGSTALLDAVYLGISKLRKAQYSRRALVIISDGGDNASRYKLKEIRNLVSESDVMVYAIGIFASGPFKSFEEVMGKRWLSTMTDITGGRTATVQNVAKLPEECALLSRELRSQYVIGYRPRAVADGKWRKIKITVTSSSDATQFRPYYRKGYYASEP
jgi:Ca-activated chloride channel family protein